MLRMFSSERSTISKSIMLANSRFLPSIIGARCLGTTARLNFKFKLTEEMSREYELKKEEEERQRVPPELALATRENSLIMGRVSHERYNNVIKVGIPKYRLNEYLLLYVKEKDDILAHDENNECKPGDWILLRRVKDPLEPEVAHKVERIVHSYGNWIDPTTGRRSLGFYYDDEMERLERIKLDA